MIAIRTRTIDDQRATRLVLAVLNDHEPAVGQIVSEAADDEHGANGLVFALATLASTLADDRVPER